MEELLCSLIIPIETRSENNMREHWAQKSSRASMQRRATWLAVNNVFQKLKERTKPGQSEGVRVRLTRIAPRALDSDNLGGALKAVRDGVADSLDRNDRDGELMVWETAQRKPMATGEAAGVEVVIWKFRPTRKVAPQPAAARRPTIRKAAP